MTSASAVVIEIDHLEGQVLKLANAGLSLCEVARLTRLKTSSVKKLLENKRKKLTAAAAAERENEFMSITVGGLWRNENGRWGVQDVRLNSGDPIQLFIEGQWCNGRIEFWCNDYYWFSQNDAITVVLRPGVVAKVEERWR